MLSLNSFVLSCSCWVCNLLPWQSDSYPVTTERSRTGPLKRSLRQRRSEVGPLRSNTAGILLGRGDEDVEAAGWLREDAARRPPASSGEASENPGNTLMLDFQPPEL